MVAPASDLREYNIKAASTHMPGRVMCSVRNHHIIVDGPVQNGFSGEEITPAELFLSAVASCGVELVQMLAIQGDLSLGDIRIEIYGVVDKANPARSDYMVFNRVRVNCKLTGVTQEVAATLVDGFTRRCPLFGTVAVATPDLQVEITVDER